MSGPNAANTKEIEMSPKNRTSQNGTVLPEVAQNWHDAVLGDAVARRKLLDTLAPKRGTRSG
jgi:hypothetical protein